MSIDSIKTQHDQVQAQIKAVNSQITRVATLEIKRLAEVAGLSVRLYKRSSNKLTRWTAKEDALMRAHYRSVGPTVMHSKFIVGRSWGAVARRAQVLGLTY